MFKETYFKSRSNVMLVEFMEITYIIQVNCRLIPTKNFKIKRVRNSFKFLKLVMNNFAFFISWGAFKCDHVNVMCTCAFFFVRWYLIINWRIVAINRSDIPLNCLKLCPGCIHNYMLYPNEVNMHIYEMCYSNFSGVPNYMF